LAVASASFAVLRACLDLLLALLAFLSALLAVFLALAAVVAVGSDDWPSAGTATATASKRLNPRSK
jgi:hypothetical protein